MDNAVDQAVRLDAFLRAHREVTIVPPQDGGGEYVASWTDDGGVTARASHFMISRLLDYLEAGFDR